MSGAAMKTSPKRFLVHDEIEEVADKHGNLHRFRVRIWRGENATPVVLVGAVDGGVHPWRMVNRLSNYVASAILGYPGPGMLYFEYGGDKILAQVYIEFFGPPERLRLFKPIDQRKMWEWFEDHVVGGPIDR